MLYFQVKRPNIPGKVKMEYFQMPYYGFTKLLELIAFEVLSLEGARENKTISLDSQHLSESFPDELAYLCPE